MIPFQGRAESKLCRDVRAAVAPGDVIFTAINRYPFSMVAEATNTWTSHVGVVLPDTDGHLVVYESTFPRSKKTSICDFIGRSDNDRVAVRRLKNRDFSSFEIARMKYEAENRLGMFYNRLFRYKRQSTTFCSKFVYQVYLNALGIEIGKLQTFQEVLDAYKGSNREELLKRFQRYFVIAIPWEEYTITPAIQLEDPKLETVFENGLEPRS